jgi:competence protein ComK
MLVYYLKGGDYMQYYRINEFTLAIIPHGNDESVCYEIDDRMVVRNNPNYIINKNCINFGSSLEGRRSYTEYSTGYVYKAPILVHEEKKIIFFPTSSPRNKQCAWINLANVEDAYYDVNKKVTKVLFSNGLVLDFKVSLNIINNQIFKALKLEKSLSKKYA